MTCVLSVLWIVCDLCGVSCRSGKRIFGVFKTIWGARRIGVGSIFSGKQNLVRSFEKKK